MPGVCVPVCACVSLCVGGWPGPRSLISPRGRNEFDNRSRRLEVPVTIHTAGDDWECDGSSFVGRLTRRSILNERGGTEGGANGRVVGWLPTEKVWLILAVRSRSGCLLLVYRAGKRVLWLTLPVLFCCRCFAPPQADYISILNGEPAPLWHVIYDDEEELGEEDLEDYEVAAVLIRVPCY